MNWYARFYIGSPDSMYNSRLSSTSTSIHLRRDRRRGLLANCSDDDGSALVQKVRKRFGLSEQPCALVPLSFGRHNIWVRSWVPWYRQYGAELGYDYGA
jgi:hypothetical protein